jgi:hypothetical protein
VEVEPVEEDEEPDADEEVVAVPMEPVELVVLYELVNSA